MTSLALMKKMEEKLISEKDERYEKYKELERDVQKELA